MFRSSRLLLSTVAKSEVAESPEAEALESDFVIILVVLLCALICVVGLFAVARCACLRRSNSPDKGLKKKVLNSLPRSNYDSATHSGLSDCPICLVEYAPGDEIRVLPQCGHEFHVDCIDTWLGSHSSCPSCRQILVVGTCQKCGEVSINPQSFDTNPQKCTHYECDIETMVPNRIFS